MAKIIRKETINGVSTTTIERQFTSLALAQAAFSVLRKTMANKEGYRLDGSYKFSITQDEHKHTYYITSK